MPTRYVHTNIVSAEWRALANFYQNVFDCVPVPPERDLSGQWLADGTGVQDAHLFGVHLRLPGHGDNGPTLEIYSYSEMLEKHEPAANRLGLGHLAFMVDDVQETVKAVIAYGGSALGSVVQKPVQGVGLLTFAYVSDPEGNIIEIQKWDP